VETSRQEGEDSTDKRERSGDNEEALSTKSATEQPTNVFTFTLLFAGFDSDPDIVLSKLNLEPDIIDRIGEYRTRKNGTVREFRSRENMWSYTEQHDDESNLGQS